ncbi:keratin, type I cytoskeletal 47 kDa-like isoform X1 [Sphaerodactylus townsendi]|uniref:keratin, type I cytoskeletal 47 kDa-like isoform X1 n=1 Tax=Sphaerodactylus townsendi TaxID=933632 RepID=UPI002026F61B|nr:keratin, type I cytoskeletal 47 kDa-like isoform X1 [Sphaerodactylus townsendi]
MQDLNDRLAAYLERVKSLEESNRKLEQCIQETYAKRASTGTPDLTGYFSTITELRAQIEEETLRNAELLLQIDNAKMAADDFRVKFESELAMHLSVERDLGNLRKALEELNASQGSLQVQVDNLQEELAFLKRNHQEEVTSLQGRLGDNVSVEVDTMPGIDLQKILAEVRDQYEEVMEKNSQEAEALHKDQKVVLEGTLTETKFHYGTELSQLRDLVAAREAELLQLRSDAQNQAEDYDRLMDLKTRLEQEIATYRCLLEGSETDPPPISESSASRRVKTVIEELVDGKVISSRVEEVEQQL